MPEGWQQAIRWIELGILGIFTAEYVLRPWKYALSVYGLIGLAAILPFYLAWGTETTALRALRLLRLIRTPSWAHQSFGRKIEKAMEYRDRKETALQIVHEEDWMQALER